MDARAFKDEVYAALGDVARALGSPRRLELLDLLVQRPRSVDALARGVGQPVANTSQHLQVLKRAHLVETERHGTTIEYRLAAGVADVFVALRRLAEARSPELLAARERFFAASGAPDVIGPEALAERLDAGTAVLLDVRPAEEFAVAHLPGAISVPIDELPSRLDEVPPGSLVVATCRGPFCTWAADAVRLLRQAGREAVRFEHGVADWRVDGGALTSEPA